jgi:hypothetical protein
MVHQEKSGEELNSQQWELALAHRKRADDAANYLRALLFALSSGGAGYVVTQIDMSLSCFVIVGHTSTFAFLALALGVLIFSWQEQKRKSIERFKWLLDSKNIISNYPAFDNSLTKKWFHKNFILDWIALGFIVIGSTVEVVTKIFSFTSDKINV